MNNKTLKALATAGGGPRIGTILSTSTSATQNRALGKKKINDFLAMKGCIDECSGAIFTLDTMNIEDICDLEFFQYLGGFLLQTFLELGTEEQDGKTSNNYITQFSCVKMAAKSKCENHPFWTDGLVVEGFKKITQDLEKKIVRELVFKGLRTSRVKELIGPEKMKALSNFLVFRRGTANMDTKDKKKAIRKYLSILMSWFAGGRGGEVAWITIDEMHYDIERGCINITWNHLKTSYTKLLSLVAAAQDSLCPILALFLYLLYRVQGETDGIMLLPERRDAVGKFLFPTLANYEQITSIVTNLNNQLQSLHSDVQCIEKTTTTKGLRAGASNVIFWHAHGGREMATFLGSWGYPEPSKINVTKLGMVSNYIDWEAVNLYVKCTYMLAGYSNPNKLVRGPQLLGYSEMTMEDQAVIKLILADLFNYFYEFISKKEDLLQMLLARALVVSYTSSVEDNINPECIVHEALETIVEAATTRHFEKTRFCQQLFQSELTPQSESVRTVRWALVKWGQKIACRWYEDMELLDYSASTTTAAKSGNKYAAGGPDEIGDLMHVTKDLNVRAVAARAEIQSLRVDISSLRVEMRSEFTTLSEKMRSEFAALSETMNSLISHQSSSSSSSSQRGQRSSDDNHQSTTSTSAASFPPVSPPPPSSESSSSAAVVLDPNLTVQQSKPRTAYVLPSHQITMEAFTRHWFEFDLIDPTRWKHSTDSNYKSRKGRAVKIGNLLSKVATSDQIFQLRAENVTDPTKSTIAAAIAHKFLDNLLQREKDVLVMLCGGAAQTTPKRQPTSAYVETVCKRVTNLESGQFERKRKGTLSSAKTSNSKSQTKLKFTAATTTSANSKTTSSESSAAPARPSILKKAVEPDTSQRTLVACYNSPDTTAASSKAKPTAIMPLQAAPPTAPAQPLYSGASGFVQSSSALCQRLFGALSGSSNVNVTPSSILVNTSSSNSDSISNGSNDSNSDNRDPSNAQKRPRVK